MVEEHTIGEMVENMMESISMIKNMALVYIVGLMEEDMKVHGHMESIIYDY